MTQLELDLQAATPQDTLESSQVDSSPDLVLPSDTSRTIEMVVDNHSLTICIDPMPVRDWLIFEEKKIEPGTSYATDKSVGLINAIKWLFPQYLFIIDGGDAHVLKPTVLDLYNFESYHIIKILSAIGTIEGDITTIDIQNGDYLNSNDFIFTSSRGGKYRITRAKIPWSATPQFIKMQGGSRGEVDRMSMYTSMIKKYFKINNEPINDEDFDDSSKLPLDVFLLIIQRLGKLIKA